MGLFSRFSLGLKNGKLIVGYMGEPDLILNGVARRSYDKAERETEKWTLWKEHVQDCWLLVRMAGATSGSSFLFGTSRKELVPDDNHFICGPKHL